MCNLIIKNLSRMLLLFYIIHSPLMADDTEIYLGTGFEPPDPKVLVIFDTSGSMSYGTNSNNLGAGESRMSIAKKVLLDIVHDGDNENLDLGLMLYNYNGDSDYDGGRVVFGVQNMITSNRGLEPTGFTIGNANSSYGRDNGGVCTWPSGATPATSTLTRKICDMRPDGSTPLEETLWEAYLYMSGQNVRFGKENGADGSGDDYTSRPRDTSVETGSGGSLNYISPVMEDGSFIDYDTDQDGDTDIDDLQCEQDYIVMMTDGEPTNDTNAHTYINALPDYRNDLGTLIAVSCSGGNGVCMPQLAGYMYHTDLGVDPGDSSHAKYVDDLQRIVTYTIGFTTQQPLLQETATAGGGQYFEASDADSLTSAFSSIFSEITASSVSFTAPGVGTSTASESRSLDYVYFSQFTPNDTPRWSGNIKKYRIVEDINNLDNDVLTDKVTVDANGILVVVEDVEGRYIYNTGVQSIWSNVVDGDNISLGGAGAKAKDHDARLIYTDAGISDGDLLSTQLFIDANANLTPAVFGIDSGDSTADEVAANNLINWVRGRKYDSGSGQSLTVNRNWTMGDPLHSSPVVINYGKREGLAGYAGDFSDLRVVAGTNGGLFHMFRDDLGDTSNLCSNGYLSNDPININYKRCADHANGTSGYPMGDSVSESWAFVPTSVTGIMSTLKANAAADPHPYGLDGDISVYKNDKNKDGNICVVADCDGDGSADADQVIVVFGMRRGGKYYYALDISNPDAPKFLWKYTHSSIEQSWSQAKLGDVRVDISGTVYKKPVAIFAAGYDTGKDVEGIIGEDDDHGRGVFIIDLISGAHIWSLRGFNNCSDSSYTTSVACSGAGETWTNTPTQSTTILYSDDLKDSMPAAVTAVDSDSDTLIDKLYVADTGGNIWRIDLYSSNRDYWSMHQMARLGRHEAGATYVNGSDRRFFVETGFVQTRKDTDNFDMLLIGSGHRNHPLESDTNNRFYAVIDRDLLAYRYQDSSSATCLDDGPPPHADFDPFCRLKPAVVGTSDLFNATSTDFVYTTIENGGDDHGWYISLGTTTETREKVMGKASIIQGRMLFTAYNGYQEDNNSCTVEDGDNYVYAINLHTGGASYDIDRDGDKDPADRKFLSDTPGILEDIPIHVDEDGDVSGISGAMPPIPFGIQTYTKAFYWFNSND